MFCMKYSLKKWVCLATVFWLMGVSAGCSDNDADPRGTVQIAVMTTGDLESRIVPYDVARGDGTLSLGGLARIAMAAQSVRGMVDGALLLSSGDDVLGSFYYMFQGEPEMIGMDMAGYEVVTPGTHEFDYGVGVYGRALEFAGFDVISANLIVEDETVSNRILPYVIKETAGIRIGIFGLMAPDFSLLCNPTGGGVQVDSDIVPIARRMVAELRMKLCDVVIGLTHIGLSKARELARGVDGIHMIVDGYDRVSLYETQGNTLIVQEGSAGEYLGVLQFAFQNGRIQNPVWNRILIDAEVGEDPEIQALMESYVAAYEEGLTQIIGDSLVDLDARAELIRRGETNLGDLIADSWLERFPQADMALVNSGSIRGDTFYPAGPLTYLTVNEMLPFRGEIVMVKMTGADIRRILEVSASAVRVEGDGCEEGDRAPTGGFMQIGGLRITLDLRNPCFCGRYIGKELDEIIHEGSRVADVLVYRDNSWVELDPMETYTVLVNGYIADGGDGQYLFLEDAQEKIVTTMLTTDILSDFIIRHTPIAPEIDGRINVTGMDTNACR